MKQADEDSDYEGSSKKRKRGKKRKQKEGASSSKNKKKKKRKKADSDLSDPEVEASQYLLGIHSYGRTGTFCLSGLGNRMLSGFGSGTGTFPKSKLEPE